MSNRTRPVNLVLLGVWLVIVAWQGIEHARFQSNAQVALIDRSRDISSTVGVVLRTLGYSGVIPQERLESALAALVAPEELIAVSVRNRLGETVAAAGEPIDLEELKGLVSSGVHWGSQSVALMNPVDLGTNVMTSAEGSRPAIILSREDMPNQGTNRPPGRMEPSMDGNTNAFREARRPDEPPPGSQGDPRDRRRIRSPFSRPYWMREEEYKVVIEKKGAHSFVMVLSTRPMQAAVSDDLWLRLIISAFAGIAVVGFATAWRNLARTADLEVRLVRASELNTRLKEMNLAAAGLAHETRNPLNIIRGLAQIISRQTDASTEVRDKSSNIIDEADRVTGQLNEFINYSRPREVRRTPVRLGAMVGEVGRALGSDLEDKGIKLHVAPDLPVIEADEQLLRQTIFNLILNAIQAGGTGGEIHVISERDGSDEIHLDVRDNGTGVPPDQRTEIFKPYVTNHPDGTGLGLTVVQQIVTAHGWEIRCLPNEPKGAIFRISHIKSAG